MPDNASSAARHPILFHLMVAASVLVAGELSLIVGQIAAWKAESRAPIVEEAASEQFMADIGGARQAQFHVGEWAYIRRNFRVAVSCPVETGISLIDVTDRRGKPVPSYPVDITRTVEVRDGKRMTIRDGFPSYPANGEARFFLREEAEPHVRLRGFQIPPVPPGTYHLHTDTACQINPMVLYPLALIDETLEVLP